MAIKLTLVSAISLVLFGMGILGSTLAQESESAGKHVFAKAGSTEQFGRGRMLSKFMLTAEQTEGRYSMISEVFGPGFSSYPGHTHKFHSEVFFVISGVMEWTVGDGCRQDGPGPGRRRALDGADLRLSNPEDRWRHSAGRPWRGLAAIPRTFGVPAKNTRL